MANVNVVMATDDHFWISAKYLWNFQMFSNMSLEFGLIFAEFCIPIMRKNDQIIWKALLAALALCARRGGGS